MSYKKNIFISCLLLALFVSLELTHIAHHNSVNSSTKDCQDNGESHSEENCPICLFASTPFKPSISIEIPISVKYIQNQKFDCSITNVTTSSITTFIGRAPPSLMS